MKKRNSMAVAVVALAAVCAGAQANVAVPGFHDHFDVTIGSGVSPAISYEGHAGTIYNDPDPSQLYCSGGTCHFGITDNNTWTSTGQVSYLIGSQDLSGPYCRVTINDGALLPEASMLSQCGYGAVTSQLLHNDNHYQFQINTQ